MPYFPTLGSYPISSGYGARNVGGGASTNHRGIDIAAPKGTQVIAPVDLTIAQAGTKGGFGNYIGGYDSSGQYYEFGHLSEIGVSAGQTVSAGSIIGATGNTGTSVGKNGGYHLHYGMKDAAGNYIDPKNFLNNSVQVGKNLAKQAVADALGTAALFMPGVREAGIAAAIAKKFGVDLPFVGGGGSGCGDWDFVCKLRVWFSDSDFYRRLMFIVIGIILFVAAFTILARTQVVRNVTSTIKG
jgi:hypothetical protein